MKDLFVGKPVERNWDVVEKFFMAPKKKMGEKISCVGPWMFPTEEEGLRRIRELVKHKVYFEAEGGGEFDVPWPTKALAEKIKMAGGKYLLAVVCHLEMGGVCYWPRHYFRFPDGNITRDPAKLYCSGVWQIPPAVATLLGAQDMADAKRRFAALAKRACRGRRKVWGDTPLRVNDSCMYAKYLYEAGFDYAAVEIFPGEPLMLMSAYRGATRGLNKKLWGTHIVTEWYGGFREDELRRRRWPAALYMAFLYGSNIPYGEGHSFNDYDRDMSKASGVEDQFYSKKYASYRNVWKKFFAFTRKKENERPAGGPITPVGILHGNLDGYLGIWESRVWGQTHSPEWEYGPAEWGWDHFYDFFRRTPWNESTAYGEEDLSGNPPMGQVDIVPIESSLKALRRYSCLLMLGWNTMTGPLYGKLLNYVRAGGRLIAAVPHLRTNVRRDEDFKLINKGDLSRLFGVKVLGRADKDTIGCFFEDGCSLPGYEFPVWRQGWFKDPVVMSGVIPLARVKLKGARPLAFAAEGADALHGYPVLVENKVGKGTTLLLTTWCYPGEPNMRDMMRLIVRNIVTGEQGPVRFVGSDKIRFAWYRRGRRLRGYFLNTDLTNRESGTIIHRSRRIPISLKPCRIKVVDL